MGFEQQDNLGTFSNEPEMISVGIFPGTVAEFLKDSRINIDPVLRNKFGALVNTADSAPISVVTRDLGYSRGFRNLKTEMPNVTLEFDEREGLLCIAGLIMPRRHGPTGPEDALNVCNAISLKDGTTISITFTDSNGWSVNNCLPDEHKFSKGTRIIFPDLPGRKQASRGESSA